MLQMLWTCCRDFSISTTSSQKAHIHHYIFNIISQLWLTSDQPQWLEHSVYIITEGRAEGLRLRVPSSANSRLLQHCCGLVVVLLWTDFHIKLKLSHITRKQLSQQVHNTFTAIWKPSLTGRSMGISLLFTASSCAAVVLSFSNVSISSVSKPNHLESSLSFFRISKFEAVDS